MAERPASRPGISKGFTEDAPRVVPDVRTWAHTCPALRQALFLLSFIHAQRLGLLRYSGLREAGTFVRAASGGERMAAAGGESRCG